MSKIVKVELPRNVYEALRLIGEACHLSVEELLTWAARGEAEAFVGGPLEAYTDHYIVPLIEKVETLLEAE